MATEHLNRPMSDAANVIVMSAGNDLASLLEKAAKEILALPTESPQEQLNDALSASMQLAAMATFSAIGAITCAFPHAPREAVWLTGITDLQMRTRALLQDYEAMQAEAQ